jgi:hypothetical protein
MGGSSIPLGSSPTIISVLQTGTNSARTSFSGVSPHVPIRIQANHVNEIDNSPGESFPEDEEDDDLMFGPLSLGKESEYLGTDNAVDSTSDQMDFLSL